MMLYYGIYIISKKLIQKGLGIQQSLHIDKELILNSIFKAVFTKVIAEVPEVQRTLNSLILKTMTKRLTLNTK